MLFSLLFLQFLEGFLPAAALVWVVLLRSYGWRRVLLFSAVVAAVPFLVMAVAWTRPRWPIWPSVPPKTLGNFVEFTAYGAVSGLALLGLRAERRNAPRWRAVGIQGVLIAAAVAVSLFVWHKTPTLAESSWGEAARLEAADAARWYRMLR